MLRPDILIIVPAFLIAIYQIKVVWGNLELYKEEDTETAGRYSDITKFRFYYLTYLVYFILIIQIGFPLFDITQNSILLMYLRILGYIFIILGFLLSLISLQYLSTNWSGMFYYRIKNGQDLITDGLYKLIRHPIYLCVILETVGFELLANSWFFLAFLIGGFLIFKMHIKNEDDLLEEKFGERYTSYKKKTKAFIPFIY